MSFDLQADADRDPVVLDSPFGEDVRLGVRSDVHFGEQEAISTDDRAALARL